MNYNSTRNRRLEATGCAAVAAGIAPDGGLYVPEDFPHVSPDGVRKLASMDYVGRAEHILGLFFPELAGQPMHDLCASAYGGGKFDCEAVAPTVKLCEGTHVLELFHGPTCAFKDMALQILPGLLTASLRKCGEERKVCILVATSGDTGKAALEGFRDVEGTEIIVFYPQDGVSDVQKLQMATQEGKNVRVFAVKGNFDDAQTGVKTAFGDERLAERLDRAGVFLSSANSINWGRLAPQIVYYFSAYCDLLNEGAIRNGDPVNFCVPTGNFGDILAGFIAAMMGLPVQRFLCASNANNVLTDFIRTGVYDRNRPFHTTISPSMDILISSNVERLIYFLSDCDDKKTAERMAALKTDGVYRLTETEQLLLEEYFYGGFSDDAETRATIASTYEKYRWLSDTHTAVALSVLAKYREETGDETETVVVSTASPYKFADSVMEALDGEKHISSPALFRELSERTGTPIPDPLAGLEDRPIRFSESVERDGIPACVQSALT